MATIERFEDIVGWQKGRELTNFVYAITRQQPLGPVILSLGWYAYLPGSYGVSCLTESPWRSVMSSF